AKNECVKQGDVCPSALLCLNRKGSFACGCDPGFKVVGYEEARTCKALDECDKQGDSCPSGLQCLKQANGSHVCGCSAGYKVIGEGEWRSCQVMDECDKRGNSCPSRLKCITRDNITHECGCEKADSVVKGEGKKRFCKEMDECDKIGKSCPSNLKCLKKNGSFACDCENTGFIVKGSGERRTCQAKDECAEFGEICPSDAQCKKQTDGFYTCVCGPGYNITAEEWKRTCEDVDECKQGNHECKGTGQKCVNIQGSYECQCEEGYLKSGANNCKLDICHIVRCKEHEVCHEGKCRCKKGFKKTKATKGKCVNAEPGRCSDDWPCPGNNPCIRNECHCPKHNTIGNGQTFCTVPDHPGGQWSPVCDKCGHYTKKKCDCGHYKNSYCITQGIVSKIPGVLEYTCKCKEGFFGRPNGAHYKHCLSPKVDKDGRVPCITDRNCHKQATCKDFKCYCKKGYEGNGHKCIALNECVKQGDFCPRLSECKKQENSSFACVCKSGFRMTGNKSLACIDIDECSEMKPCFAKCNNTVGSHQCICENGKPTNESGFCDCKCKKYGNGDCPKGSSKCSCNDGYKYSEEEDKCIDINECEGKKNPCVGAGKQCFNRAGSYECQCKKGFVKNGSDCKAIITCADITCKENQICHEERPKAKCIKVLALSTGWTHSSSFSIYLGVMLTGYLGGLALVV
ncbi:unnamed protein product, partial [Porites lobata]